MNWALVLPLLLAGPRAAVAGPPASAAAIQWEKNFDDARKKARKSGKPIFVDFWADWCGWCDRLDRTTYADQVVARRAQSFVAVKVDTEGSRKEQEVAIRYGVVTLPTIIFLSPEGRLLWRVHGFQGPGAFPATMDHALGIARNVMSWEATLAHDPDDPAALAALGDHAYQLGSEFSVQACFDEARELLQKAIARDAAEPLGNRRRARMLLAILHHHLDRDFVEAEKLVKQALSLGPEDDEEPRLLFVLGQTYLSAGRMNESVETFQIIVRQYPKSPIAPKARETLSNLQR